MKSIYRHKLSGDLFAIETDPQGNILSTAGPLMFKDIDPDKIDYDNYFSSEIKLKQDEFELLSRVEYEELLRRCGFGRQVIQKYLF
ncbi:MAG: hypothetical protein ABFD91_13740 [Anaerohalosphaeraceae bacterium]